MDLQSIQIKNNSDFRIANPKELLCKSERAANIDNEKELKKIKRKYKYLSNLPNLTSFQKTVDYIRD